ncbi:hypothetical protein JCM19237_1465 [Photobacterium aphoticum]|uniref:Uncharacterized protein n=1 Tax=Photobacterium aphoticum TaxID=754436 RepID=A0A090QWI9_9GAMM|nr:hypothetical protein JCM19237_1465 [Photobacterium aphoticum]
MFCDCTRFNLNQSETDRTFTVQADMAELALLSQTKLC